MFEKQDEKEILVNQMQKNLDDFIQNSLNKFKFDDVKKELINNVGDDINLIISYKSTIPDLVIWNKPFNKNECFYLNNNQDLKYNSFPRVPFYLRLNNNHNNKIKSKKYFNHYKKNEENNTSENLFDLVEKLNLSPNNQNSPKETQKESSNNNNINNKINSDLLSDKNICENNSDETTKISLSPPIKRITNYITPVSKEKKTMNDYYQNQFNRNEILINHVYSFLDKKGWIVFKNNGDYLFNLTSFDLFAFLTNVLNNKNDVKMFIIGMQTDSFLFNGEQIYIILSQTLPFILQNKQLEYETMRKKMSKENENKKILKLKNDEKENICNNYSSIESKNNSRNNFNKNIKSKNLNSEYGEYNSKKYQI